MRTLLHHTCTALAIATLAGCASKQAAYPTPEAAVDAFVSAVHPRDEAQLRTIFGPDSADLIDSGDPVADKDRAAHFYQMYQDRHEIGMDDAGGRVLIVGKDAWPFPIPLVEENGKWIFDTAAGKEEILNRRIGANELDTIQTCLAIVDAQREYATLDTDGSGVSVYADRFISEPGKKNGLYWPAAPGQADSPLGELVADAEAEGYSRGTARNPAPYHGYFFRILTSQGPNAAGGAYSYVANGRMIGGFGLVAWPVNYGSSGIMTFITNQDGVVYQQDLGDDTDRAAKAIKAFDPGPGWVRVEQVK